MQVGNGAAVVSVSSSFLELYIFYWDTYIAEVAVWVNYLARSVLFT